MKHVALPIKHASVLSADNTAPWQNVFELHFRHLCPYLYIFAVPPCKLGDDRTIRRRIRMMVISSDTDSRKTYPDDGHFSMFSRSSALRL